MPVLLLFILFIGVPILEIWILIQVGEAIGVLPTIALLVADSILGGLLMRSQGRRAWRRFREALAAGRVPARETLDGALIIFGGAFLMTPGFASDVFGVLFLLPPTRAVVRRLLTRRFGARMVVGVTNPPRFRSRTQPRPGFDDDVEGTAREANPRRLP